jgi:hypothetical protein
LDDLSREFPRSAMPRVLQASLLSQTEAVAVLETMKDVSAAIAHARLLQQSGDKDGALARLCSVDGEWNSTLLNSVISLAKAGAKGGEEALAKALQHTANEQSKVVCRKKKVFCFVFLTNKQTNRLLFLLVLLV